VKSCDLVVTYDVDTTTKEGARRLRKVAKICEHYGQRVQFSVFEVRVSSAMREELEARLRKTINQKTDSLRLYDLADGRDRSVTTYGVDRYTDFDGPLVV